MRRKYLSILSSVYSSPMITSGVIFLFAGVASAANTLPAITPIATSSSDVICILQSITDYMFWIILTVSTIMVMYAAYTYITATDDAEKTSKARKTITYAAVGIVVALMAKGFPSIIESVFPASVGSGTITCPV